MSDRSESGFFYEPRNAFLRYDFGTLSDRSFQHGIISQCIADYGTTVTCDAARDMWNSREKRSWRNPGHSFTKGLRNVALQPVMDSTK
jgi:hypothetical protein